LKLSDYLGPRSARKVRLLKSSSSVGPDRHVLKARHLASFNGRLERFEAFFDFSDFLSDQFGLAGRDARAQRPSAGRNRERKPETPQKSKNNCTISALDSALTRYYCVLLINRSRGNHLLELIGNGRGGIRTHGTVTRTPDFESGAFDQLSHPSICESGFAR
jgi:hypothetical protein